MADDRPKSANTPDDAERFDIELVHLDGHAVLALRGDLDLSTSARLAEAAQLVHAQGVATLIFDLAGLVFVDSSGLREFVVALKGSRQLGGDVILKAPSRQVLRVLEIVGMTDMFTLA